MDEVFVFLIVMTIAITIYSMTELKYSKKGKSPDFKHLLAEELADRDDKASALEERIRVLEKIVTDTHKSHALSEEIDQLKEQVNDK